MKIAITAREPKLEAELDPRFGRAAYFVVVETDGGDYETIENPNVDLPSGAGIQSAQLIAGKGVTALLTGSCGPKAYDVLEAAGVSVYVGTTGTVSEAVEAFKSGGLLPTDGPDVQAHTYDRESGVGGKGGGRGKGGGCAGRGAGRGSGHGAEVCGVCVCPGCGATVDHVRGVPCSDMACPQCGSSLVRG
jgi:predicted Fe-Mo cluster-binding NifX family protein